MAQLGACWVDVMEAKPGKNIQSGRKYYCESVARGGPGVDWSLMIVAMIQLTNIGCKPLFPRDWP